MHYTTSANYRYNWEKRPKCHAPKIFDPHYLENWSDDLYRKITHTKGVPTLCRSANLEKILSSQKISGSPDMNFWLGGPDPQILGPSPPVPGAL